jgi:hypothetical protein
MESLPDQAGKKKAHPRAKNGLVGTVWALDSAEKRVEQRKPSRHEQELYQKNPVLPRASSRFLARCK